MITLTNINNENRLKQRNVLLSKNESTSLGSTKQENNWVVDCSGWGQQKRKKSC